MPSIPISPPLTSISDSVTDTLTQSPAHLHDHMKQNSQMTIVTRDILSRLKNGNEYGAAQTLTLPYFVTVPGFLLRILFSNFSGSGSGFSPRNQGMWLKCCKFSIYILPTLVDHSKDGIRIWLKEKFGIRNRFRCVTRVWIRIRSISDRIRNPAQSKETNTQKR